MGQNEQGAEWAKMEKGPNGQNGEGLNGQNGEGLNGPKWRRGFFWLLAIDYWLLDLQQG
jgi:hypothetical protein